MFSISCFSASARCCSRLPAAKGCRWLGVWPDEADEIASSFISMSVEGGCGCGCGRLGGESNWGEEREVDETELEKLSFVGEIPGGDGAAGLGNKSGSRDTLGDVTGSGFVTKVEESEELEELGEAPCADLESGCFKLG